ncbi:MAG: hypothetical protein HYX76_03530 [Acidobacteria bacterium]|nr:hypothetical protein [Acidobacteriota bacterium]
MKLAKRVLVATGLMGCVIAGSTADAEAQVGIRGFAAADYHVFTGAEDSFKAVLGSSSAPVFGGGGGVTWKWLFVQVEGSRFRDTGQRVFRSNNEIFRLGIPVTVTMTAWEFEAGVRVDRGWPVVPYVGGGVGSLRYKETSQFAESGENVNRSKPEYIVLGGVEVPVWRWIRIAGQVKYIRATGIIGKDGISQQFGEKDLGGPSAGLRIIVAR